MSIDNRVNASALGVTFESSFKIAWAFSRVCGFRAAKRSKHARVLAARQSPKFEKMAGILSIL